MSCCPFESSNTSKFIIFQGEHKGPKNEILISGAPKSLVPGFHTVCVMWYWQILIEFGEAQIGNQQYSNVFTRYETLIHTLCSY